MKNKKFWGARFALFSEDEHHVPPRKTAFSQMLHCHFPRDTADSAKATTSFRQVLGLTQNPHTQGGDLEERAEGVNDCGLERRLCIHLAFDT